jgi:RNA polymerase sigma-70 factor (ECF subfamily)
MNGGRIEAGRPLERLFSLGAIGGLGDAELLERFAAADDEAAGAAFEAIVARHGPMVLRVCRAILRDAHAAEDAFQATFLVLARRARMIGERERLGNWLFGVAARTARKARTAAARQAARERAAAGLRPIAVVEMDGDTTADDLGRALHEEIGRLPGSYRSAVVACYLEGLTQEQAARRLRLTESTVRGRLARARKLLGQRLARRGVAPAVGLAALEDSAARLPEASVRSLARDALSFARSAGPATRGAVPSTAQALADGVLSTMWLPSLKTIALAAVVAAAGLGLTAAVAFAPGRPAAESAPSPVPAPDPRPAAAPASPLPQDAAERRPNASRKTQKAGSSAALDPALVKRAPGPILRSLPISKDCTIIAYLPNQNLGHVDNFAVYNYGGGVRALLEWPEIPLEEAAAPGRRFLVALYARRTTSHPPTGQIHAFEILDKWPELNAWSIQPRYDPEPSATYKFEPGEGWKLFDVTHLVRSQVKPRRECHGILLRFLSEDFKREDVDGSGYHFVSREGAGEWAARRPVLLVVEDTAEDNAPPR